MIDRSKLRTRIRMKANLVFESAFHIGSGKEGDMATDMGVLRDQSSGEPILPGSSLKGKFRATAEQLAGHLNLSACLLDMSLSGVECVTDENYRRKCHPEYQKLSNENKKLQWVDAQICDVCRLFGSPMHASRIFFSDGQLKHWSGNPELRDGVCLDRDSETARPNMKYDFEVIPNGTVFGLQLDMENPEEQELALVGAVLAEWEQGFRLGGKTSRGLGLARLESLQVERVDLSDREQLGNYLLHKKMTPSPELFTEALEMVLETQGGQADA
ncbi:MAG: CRISPR-associated RAMP protein Csx7 [Desulfohalobiaceae bacterium]